MSNPYGNNPSYQNSPMGAPPKNWLVESILALIFCGGLLAIPALIYASQVDSKYNSGDYYGALEASKNAKMWCLIAVGISVGCTVVGGLVWVLMVIGMIAAGA